MERLPLGAIAREYLRRASVAESQKRLAERIGVPRQNLNQILLGGRGREVTLAHLDSYAQSVGKPLSILLRDIAQLAWEVETRQAVPTAEGAAVSPAMAEQIAAATSPAEAEAARPSARARRGRQP